MGMSDKTIVARMRGDGTVVRVMPDGSEEPFPHTRTREMTEEEVRSAALSDPDAQPFTEEQLTRARRVPRVRTLRRALGLTQEEFAARFGLSLATLRDWEQGRTQPDQAANTYLEVIARAPDAVMGARGTAPEATAGRQRISE
jgi:putative transcriptional regulator